MEKYPSQVQNYYEWVRNLTIPAVEMSDDDTSYRCTVQTNGLSNEADYNFTVVGADHFCCLNAAYFVNSFIPSLMMRLSYLCA